MQNQSPAKTILSQNPYSDNYLTNPNIDKAPSPKRNTPRAVEKAFYPDRVETSVNDSIEHIESCNFELT